MALKDLIKEVREKANLTQKEMAEKMNTTSMTVSRWERGTNEPNSETLEQMGIEYRLKRDEDEADKVKFCPISEAIRQKREELGLTQEQFAKLYGVTPLAVHKWEKGLNKPAKSRLKELNLNIVPASNLRPIDRKSTLHIPLVSPIYRVCAGDGNCYEDGLEYEGTHDLNSPELSALYNEDSLIAMRVEGDSMTGKHINDGDTVIFDRSRDWITGNICLVCFDGKLMIKGLISQGNNKPPILRSANPDYKDIIVTEDNQFEVLGKLITVDPKNFNPGSII